MKSHTEQELKEIARLAKSLHFYATQEAPRKLQEGDSEAVSTHLQSMLKKLTDQIKES